MLKLNFLEQKKSDIKCLLIRGANEYSSLGVRGGHGLYSSPF